MKITALKQQIKNPERVSIFVDGKYSFSLSLDELARHKIKNGDELSAREVEKFQKISADGKLRMRALEWLMNRPHSTREFNDYLRRKKADAELSEQLASEFTGKNYLNDANFAKWLVEIRSKAGKSNRAIRAELFKKGINRDIADEVLSESDDEAARLKTVIAKKRNLSRYQDPQKFMRYLISQGFSYELVKKELSEN